MFCVCRLLVAGHKAGDAPGCAGGYVVLSGRLSDVRGFNDFLQDFLVQVRRLTPAHVVLLTSTACMGCGYIHVVCCTCWLLVQYPLLLLDCTYIACLNVRCFLLAAGAAPVCMEHSSRGRPPGPTAGVPL